MTGNGSNGFKNLDPKVVAWILAAALYLIVEVLKFTQAPRVETGPVVEALREINAEMSESQTQFQIALEKIIENQDEIKESLRSLDGVAQRAEPLVRETYDGVNDHRRATENSGHRP